VTRLEVIRPFVEQTVREFLGVDELKVMEDGTISIRAGSSAVNVRLLEGPAGGHPLLRVASPMLHDVPPSRELLEKLNEMNAAFSFARVFEVDGSVIIAMELFAEELTAAQIEYACGLITFAADHWDDELRRTFGGQTFFEGDGTVAMPDPPTGADPSTGPSTRDEPAAGNGAGYL
jgi:type III secretion system-like peptide-binding chaperone